MLLQSADFQFKFEFRRKICRKSTLRSRILFKSIEVIHKISFNSYYILISRTHTKLEFLQETKMLALGGCFQQPCWIYVSIFAASRSRLN